MKKIWIVLAVLAWAGAVPLALASDFDGSKALICSLNTVYECTPDTGCRWTTTENVSLPSFLKVDVSNRKAMPARGMEGRPGSDIKRVELIGGKLILQGADAGIDQVREGLGWTAAISEDDGKLILTASGDEVAFVIFGSCIPH